MVGDFWAHLDRAWGRLPECWRGYMANFPAHHSAAADAGITSAALLVFIFDFTSFGVDIVLGGRALLRWRSRSITRPISLFNLRWQRRSR